MSLAREGVETSTKLSGDLAPLFEDLMELVASAEGDYELVATGAGLELAKIGGRPRVLFFEATKKRLIAFFYKPSRLGFSRDRFSYGALHLHPDRVEEARRDFAAGLAFLAADFTPAERPQRLRRSLDVTVPEND